MKTKEFIARVEALNFVGKAEKGMSGSGLIGFPNKNGEALISVNEYLAYHFNTDYRAFKQLHLRDKRKLANIAWKYAKTPLEEREEEKKYRYKLSSNFDMKNTLTCILPGETFFFSSIEEEDYNNSTLKFQKYFTDKDVERMPKDVRDVFNACEKIEVSP